MSDTDFRSFIQEIASRAQTHPKKTAVTFDGSEISYVALMEQASAVAIRVRELGLPTQTPVGMSVLRGPGMVAAILGILMSGCAFVPLDPTMPVERLGMMVTDAGISAVVGDITPALANLVPHWLALPDIIDEASNEAVWHVDAVEPEDLAYIMFTSGSTGRPKGVRIPHRAVANLLESMMEWPGLAAEDYLLAVTSPGFDMSVPELFLPLKVGATIVLASDSERLDGRELSRLIQTHDISVMQATPATWRILLAHGWDGKADLKILTGGEALDQALARQLLDRCGALWNLYGPTETTVYSSGGQIIDADAPIHVGEAISNTDLAILNTEQRPVTSGEVGELYIGGQGVALGYTDSALDVDRFMTLPDAKGGDHKYYRTGDLARWESDRLILLGRSDDQVKIDGHRIELDEVRAQLRECNDVEEATVVAWCSTSGRTALVGVYRLTAQSNRDAADIRAQLSRNLPGYMVPAHLLTMREIPLTPSGKVDHKSVRAWVEGQMEGSFSKQAQCGSVASILTKAIVRHVQDMPLGRDDNFFEAGVTSLQANIIAAELTRKLGMTVSVAKIFSAPTIRQLEPLLERARDNDEGRNEWSVARLENAVGQANEVAIVGMAIRVPGASTLDEFWDVLKSGRETLTRFTEEDDDRAVSARIRQDPGYVRARGMIKEPKEFDAKLFGISPTDARVMDPQQRVFLELAWEALENAGYHSESAIDRIGVYAGMGNNFYFVHNIFPYPDLEDLVGEFQIEIGREKDHIATLVSHKLNLKGPSISLNTACSTGLVAIDQAWHSLRSGQCDMALAGAIELRTPQMSGQIAEPGGIFAEDGHCRPFSDDSSGTMFSDGAGIVVLKRLSDAIADGDGIYGVIRGSAVNHDGRHKKSYLAPSIDGQVDVIRTAQDRAGIAPRMVSYIEAHGTATPVGDPIEFEALLRAFGPEAGRTQFCALGSVKANLGHPTTASGVVGVIKVALMLKNRTIPAQINFSRINRNIDIEQSPFFITSETIDWENGVTPRLAGVSSFGFCGTNAHVILEEAPQTPAFEVGNHPRPYALVVDSAATEASLAAHKNSVTKVMASKDRPHLGSLAYTMAVGRKALEHRSFSLLDQQGVCVKSATKHRRPDGAPRNHLAFLFPGQGAQYIGMGSDLFRSEPFFRKGLEDVADAIAPHLGQSIFDVMWAEDELASTRLNNTAFTQPAIFSVSYALGRLFREIGIEPDVFIGHSIGEISAAALSGVFSLEDAAKLIVARGRIMSEMVPGSMLSVPMPEEDVCRLMPLELSLAAVNGPSACVVGGPDEAIAHFAAKMSEQGHDTRKLRTSHAFHSWMMDAGLEAFRTVFDTISLKAPGIPILSTVTGHMLSDVEARSPDYWVTQIRNTVRFAAAISEFWKTKDALALELGPRKVLTTLSALQIEHRAHQRVFPTLGEAPVERAESMQITDAMGHLWANDIPMDWDRYYGAPEMARRISVPTYVFDRKPYWFEAPETTGEHQSGAPLSALDSCTSNEVQLDSSKSDGGILPRLLALLTSVSGESYEDVQHDASLTELGFDSLLLTPVAHLIKQTFGTEISFEELTSTASTLNALCVRLESDTLADPIGSVQISEKLLEKDTGGQSRKFGMTRIQSVLCAQATCAPEIAEKIVDTATIRLKGQLNKPALRSAISLLAARHDALRVCLAPNGDGFVELDLQAEHLIHAIYVRVEGPLDARPDFVQQPTISLNDGPLIRFVLIGEKNDHELVLQAHRIVADGWSLDVLVEELGALYYLVLKQKSEDLPQADRPLAYIQREAGLLESIEANASELFWRRELDHAERDDSHDFPAPVALSTAELGQTTLDGLKAQARNNEVSLFTCLLVCLKEIQRATRGDTVHAFVTSAGQPIANEPRLVWQCSNQLSVHWPIPEGGSFGEMLRIAQDQLVRTHKHKAYPLAALPGAFGTNVQLTHVQRLSVGKEAFSGLEWEYRLDAPHYQSACLSFQITEFTDRLVISQTHRPDLVSDDEARATLESYATALRKVADLSQGANAVEPVLGVAREKRAANA